MTNSLRNAILARDEEDCDAVQRAVRDDAHGRLDAAAAFGGVVDATLNGRLREPVSDCLGEPCEPFHPQIHLEASMVIGELEAGDPLNGPAVADLVCRLIGLYGLGHGGRPEFGYRLYPTTPLKLEAAGRICALSPEVGASLGILTGEAEPEEAPGP